MEEIIFADDFLFWIRQKRESEAEFLRHATTLFGIIDTDADDSNATFVELGKLLLKTPKLGVTHGSPMTAVENHEGALAAGEQIGEWDRLAVLVGEGEIRGFLSGMRGLR